MAINEGITLVGAGDIKLEKDTFSRVFLFFINLFQFQNQSESCGEGGAWSTLFSSGFLRMHDAVAEEIAANKARVADVTANAPKFPELAAKAEAVVQGMKSLDTKAAARKTALQEQLQK